MRIRTSSGRRPIVCDAAGAGIVVVVLLLASAIGSGAEESQWVRPGKQGDPFVWGRRDGMVFGLYSTGGIKGPRGLIRIGLYPTPQAAAPELLNFIAVEP